MQQGKILTGRKAALKGFRLIEAALIGIIAMTMALNVPAWAGDFPLQEVLPLPGFAEGWAAKEPVKLFDRDTLFEHINGEAELYMPYGFDLLATAAYTNSSDPDIWLVADVYRMGSLLDAFGIYANYRRGKSQGVELGAEGFVTPSQLMFYQDRYFVRLQVTGATYLPPDVFLACGRTVAGKLPDRPRRPGEMEMLHIPALVPATERYITQSLLGYAFFRRGLIADAHTDGHAMQVFVVMNDAPDTARKAFSQYQSYLMKEGRDLRIGDASQTDTLTAVDPLYGGVIAERSGKYIIGALRWKDAAAADRVLKQMRAKAESVRNVYPGNLRKGEHVP
jgi:hypothetical protein